MSLKLIIKTKILKICTVINEFKKGYQPRINIIKDESGNLPRVVTGNKNSLTVTHACRKRRLIWVATLPLGDINTEAWSSGMGAGHGAKNPTL
jgi:hypothetical protein